MGKAELLNNEVLVPYREAFPHLRQPHYYLNHAAFGVLSSRVNQNIAAHLKERSEGIIESYLIDLEIIEETRQKIARLINAPSADQIAFVTNTSEGLNLIASGLSWGKGDRILLNDAEFPSNVYPFKNLEKQGVDVYFAPSREGSISAVGLERHLTPETRLVSVSAVQFLSGYRIDLHKLGTMCSDRNTWLIVDGIQALGHTPIDVQAMGIHGLVSGGLKWLMAPMGIGFVYLSEELMQAMTPPYVGWLSVETPWDLYNHHQQLNPTARRHELGGLNVPGIYALHASVDPFLELGKDQIYSHVLALAERIIEKMAPAGLPVFGESIGAERSGIVSFVLPDTIDGDALVEWLRKSGVTVSHRMGKLRFSPHFYNSTDDIDAAVDRVLQGLSKSN